MIASICGSLIHKSANYVIVDVQGVGYGISIPLSTFYELPEANNQVRLMTYTHVSEAAIKLFGFLTVRERQMFELMISVSGIGPKLAVTILSGISPEHLEGALSTGNLDRLVSIPGIGRKTAERMILELKEKVSVKTIADHGLDIDDDLIENDALSALVNLGYKESAARNAVRTVRNSAVEKQTLEALLMESLKLLSM